MSAEKQQHDLAEADSPRAGQLVNMEVRTARADGNKGNAIVSNLTRFGRKYHGIEEGDSLRIAVFEEGIWISK